ncbi:hypothetical protein AAFF_G00221170 [Aldrovandia affinis]|uniref:Uncharacterized protein n=1 Tax=Aldrovandia affinis TaxID=143900 RepID=A0AAD7RG23_9TELE|nr:hypothetical protein AAFF_G00221170 [Aldrovandia affinis]
MLASFLGCVPPGLNLQPPSAEIMMCKCNKVRSGSFRLRSNPLSSRGTNGKHRAHMGTAGQAGCPASARARVSICHRVTGGFISPPPPRSQPFSARVDSGTSWYHFLLRGLHDRSRSSQPNPAQTPESHWARWLSF